MWDERYIYIEFSLIRVYAIRRPFSIEVIMSVQDELSAIQEMSSNRRFL